MKKEECFKLPFNRMPSKNKLAKICDAELRSIVLTAEVKKAGKAEILELDAIYKGKVIAREFCSGEKRLIQEIGSEAVIKMTSRSMAAGLSERFTQWASPAAEARALSFFNLKYGETDAEPGAIPPQSAYNLLLLIEHAKLENGVFKAKGAGAAGGYAAEALIDDEALPQNLAEVMRDAGMDAPHVLLCKKDKITDPLTDLKLKVYRCKCSNCGEEFTELQDLLQGVEYGAGSLVICDGCGEVLKTVYVKNKKSEYAAERGSLMVFTKKGRTFAANAYEIFYYVDVDAKEHWEKRASNVYAWGDFGAYEYRNYYHFGLSPNRQYLGYWFSSRRNMNDNWKTGGKAVVLPPKAGMLVGTPLRHARLSKYLALTEHRYKEPICFLKMSLKVPALEVMADSADIGAIETALCGLTKVKKGARTPWAAFELTKEEYKRSTAEHWDVHMLNMFKKCKAGGWLPCREVLRDISMRDYFASHSAAEIKKTWTYLKRVLRREAKINPAAAHTFNNALNTYRDYKHTARELGRELESEDELYPYDLFARHDRYVAELNARREAEVKKKDHEKVVAFAKIYKKIKWADYADDKFIIKAAKSSAELRAEGAALHHCVGTYTPEVLNGKVIFFIRRASEPDKPYYTLNIDIKTDRLIQLHGFANDDTAPDYKKVHAWAKKWLNEVWIKGKEKRRKRGAAA